MTRDKRTTRGQAQRQSSDAFISHASADAPLVDRLESSLQAQGFSVWVDRAQIRGGSRLAPDLMRGLLQCRNVVVLWSSDAAKSEWVNTEWTSIVNYNHQKDTTDKKGIIPCRLDQTPLALFLLNYVFCDFRSSYEAGLRCLVDALRGSVVATPPPAHWERERVVDEILAGQSRVLELLGTGDLPGAKRQQQKLDPIVAAARGQVREDLNLLILEGYQRKNEYMLRHWDQIQSGQSPQDDVLNEALDAFFKALSIQPDNPSALNGIGSVFLLRRDLDAADFYIRRAVDRAKQEGLSYDAAALDLGLVRRLKGGRKPEPAKGSRSNRR